MAVINRGEVLFIFGPSGGGKSTLLRCINRLATVDRGTITVDGICVTEHPKRVDIDKVRTEVGMVFQEFNLFNHLTAMKNVAVGPIRVKGMAKEEAYELAKFELERVGLEDKADAYPGQLSGGQKQRVAIARAVANSPKLLLADEPTGNLDPETAEVVFQQLLKLVKDTGLTAIIATHNLDLARRMTRIWKLDQSKIVESAPADI